MQRIDHKKKICIKSILNSLSNEIVLDIKRLLS